MKRQGGHRWFAAGNRSRIHHDLLLRRSQVSIYAAILHMCVARIFPPPTGEPGLPEGRVKQNGHKCATRFQRVANPFAHRCEWLNIHYGHDARDVIKVTEVRIAQRSGIARMEFWRMCEARFACSLTGKFDQPRRGIHAYGVHTHLRKAAAEGALSASHIQHALAWRDLHQSQRARYQNLLVVIADPILDQVVIPIRNVIPI